MALVLGTLGDDFPLLGSPDDDHIYGLDGNDGMRGFEGNDLMDGGRGDDSMRADEGDDSLYGGDGNDFMRGGAGNDLMDGGSGFDRVSFADVAALVGISVDLRITGPQDTGQGIDTLVSVEHASGTQHDDHIVGNASDNWLWGGSDGLTVGNDEIHGGQGNDLITVGRGDHLLSGGVGVDTFSLFHNGTDIGPEGGTVSLARQGAAQDTDQGMMTLSGFENLSGSPFDDDLTGDNEDNLLAGNSGNDVLVGRDGDDTLYGDGAVDPGGNVIETIVDVTQLGDPGGDDILDGGKGRDLLDGGTGNDVLTGGQQHDTFQFGFLAGDDIVTDFKNGDKIRFENAGVLAFEDLTIAKSGKHVLISWGDDSALLLNTNVNQLDPGDFIFA